MPTERAAENPCKINAFSRVTPAAKGSALETISTVCCANGGISLTRWHTKRLLHKPHKPAGARAARPRVPNFFATRGRAVRASFGNQKPQAVSSLGRDEKFRASRTRDRRSKARPSPCGGRGPSRFDARGRGICADRIRRVFRPAPITRNHPWTRRPLQRLPTSKADN